MTINFTELGGLILIIGTFLYSLFRRSGSNVEQETKAQDAPLVQKQEEIKADIKEVDKGIDEMKAERERLRNEYLTDQQRADQWNKPKQ